MIGKVKITDNTRLPKKYRYAADLSAFANGKEYDFRPGINIVIGRNGCGKSTLLNIIKAYMWCSKTWVSKIPREAFKFPQLWDDKTGEVLDGMQIQSDYAGVVYNYIPSKEMDSDDILSSGDRAFLYMDGGSSSTGEQQIQSLGYLFDAAFRNNDVTFPVHQFVSNGAMNDYWKPRFVNLMSYYKRNRLQVSKDTFEYTFLLDEPDRNLDIDNIDSIYEILSYRKEMTQIVAVVHNPILIYKLSKLKHINFVEMSDGYLDSIKKVFRKLYYER